MGIQLIQRPKGAENETPGPLMLPFAFDRVKSAAKWVKVGPAVDAAREREWLAGTRLTADGWEVWRDADNKPHKVSLQSGEHVLLHRPRAVQDAVNAICGNVGKERLLQERRGETTGGVPVDDPGLLSDARIARVAGHDPIMDDTGDVVMNNIPDVERDAVEAAPLRTAASPRVPIRRAT